MLQKWRLWKIGAKCPESIEEFSSVRRGLFTSLSERMTTSKIFCHQRKEEKNTTSWFRNE